MLAPAGTPLAGRRALITSGPTREPIDPVRYISNHSSGKQGHAVAAALAALGAAATLVTGPSAEADPAGVEVVRVETAQQMLAACQAVLPVDIAVCAAAVADWRIAAPASDKMKKDGAGAPELSFVENPDILATIAGLAEQRPALVVGFAAETENVVENALAKCRRKGCDWLVANDVSGHSGTFGGEHNTVHLIEGDASEAWPKLSKQAVGERLGRRIADHFAAAD
jgi:phosphopantothenoylcysteine decarboxylase/phosphopantothenate--cysteine ligase